MKQRTPFLAGALLLTGLSLTGCSFNLGGEADPVPPTVAPNSTTEETTPAPVEEAPAEETSEGLAVESAVVAQQAADALEEQVGYAPEVTCSDDLPAEVGATITCDLTDPADGALYDMEVTATSVSADGEVLFDIQVAQTPKG